MTAALPPEMIAEFADYEAIMTWWIWTSIGIYLIGFLVMFFGHIIFLQMVTPELALMRSLVWPIFWATGWPHGSPMTMD